MQEIHPREEKQPEVTVAMENEDANSTWIQEFGRIHLIIGTSF